MGLEAEIHHLVPQVGIPDFQHHLIPMAPIPVAPVIIALHLAADHGGADGVVVIFRLLKGPDDMSVSQNREGVAPLLDLIQVMRDKYHRPVTLPHPVHQVVNDVAALLGQGGGGLVHHQHLRLLHPHLGYLYQLTVLHIKGVRPGPGVDVGCTNVVQRLLRRPHHSRTVDKSPAAPILFAEGGKAVCLTQEHILCHRDLGHSACLLDDHTHSPGGCPLHGTGLPGLSLVEHLTGVRRLHPGKDRRHGGFPRPVLPDQAPDLAPLYQQVHSVQRYHGAKHLRDAPAFQNDFMPRRLFHARTPLLKKQSLLLYSFKSFVFFNI